MAFQFDNGAIADRDALVTKLKDVLVLAGWTLHDDQFVGSGYYVLYNNGGVEGLVPFYVQLQTYSTDKVKFWGWYTHPGGGAAGANQIGTGSNSTVLTSDIASHSYWISATLHGFVISTQVGVTVYASECGLYYPYLGTGSDGSLKIQPTNGAATAGGSAVIPMANTSFFAVGQKVFIREGATLEKITIDAINPNVSITANLLANSYGSGAFVGRDPVPFMIAPILSSTALLAVISTGVPSFGLGGATRSADAGVAQGDPDTISGLNHIYPDILVVGTITIQGKRGYTRATRRWGGTAAQGDTMNVGSQVWVVIRAFNISFMVRRS